MVVLIDERVDDFEKYEEEFEDIGGYVGISLSDNDALLDGYFTPQMN